MTIDGLIKKIQSTPDCEVFPSLGIPSVKEGHFLPEDLKTFFSLCGGAVLFRHASYPFYVSTPSQFVLANPVIVGEAVEDDISSSWYIVGSDGTESEYITIDLNQERLGRCYDSFWDRHGVPGSCAVIATSFTDLVERLLANSGAHWYWLEPTFESLGDAYD